MCVCRVRYVYLLLSDKSIWGYVITICCYLLLLRACVGAI